MNKRILIINENSTNPLYSETGVIVPLGPLYVASFLESKGIPVDFIDRNVEYKKRINFEEYDIIGFSVTVNNIENTIKTLGFIKTNYPKIGLVVGGPFANAYPGVLINIPYLDAIFVGEAEESFYEYACGKDKYGIKGIYFRNNGEFHFAGTKQWITNLDSLPFPSLQKIKISAYTAFSSKNLPISNIVTSRGCPYQCTFCFHNLGFQWRPRSPKNVVDEIEWQVRSIGVREIIIQDDNFSFDVNRAKEIFDEVIRRDIKVGFQFQNGIRADHLDRELIEKMSKAGVWLLCFSPETGNAETFRRLNKGFTLEHIKNAIKLAKEFGIATNIFLMLGFPWEVNNDFNETINLAFKLNTDFVYLSKYIPFPETGLYKAGNIRERENDILRDRSYVSPREIVNGKKINELIAKFYKRYYLNPKRLIKIVILLRLYSLFKLSSPFVLINILRRFRVIFFVNNKRKVKN